MREVVPFLKSAHILFSDNEDECSITDDSIVIPLAVLKKFNIIVRCLAEIQPRPFENMHTPENWMSEVTMLILQADA